MMQSIYPLSPLFILDYTGSNLRQTCNKLAVIILTNHGHVMQMIVSLIVSTNSPAKLFISICLVMVCKFDALAQTKMNKISIVFFKTVTTCPLSASFVLFSHAPSAMVSQRGSLLLKCKACCLFNQLWKHVDRIYD